MSYPAKPPPVVIAEIAGNHGGNLQTAFEMIDAAADAGADYVKFQKRDVEASRAKWEAIPRNDQHAFGANEYEHRKALEFTVEQHEALSRRCDVRGVSYTCSAWDQVSLAQLEALAVPWVKVPSAKNQEWFNWRFKPETEIHVSLGLTSAGERDRILRVSREVRPFTVFYACTSTYPCENADVYLSELEYLKARVTHVGFSGHHRGIQMDVAAYVLGAEYIERHFTLDRTSKGTDHAASLEPAGLSRLVRDLEAVASAWRPKPGGLPPCEEQARKKLKGG